MANTTSLRKYLLLTFPDLKGATELKANEWDSHSNSFSTFLDSVRVVIPHRHQFHEKQLRHHQEDMSHSEFIDSICKGISSFQNDVILVNYSSYHVGQLDNKIRFQVNCLKGTEWAKLCAILGRSRFASFVLSVDWCCDESAQVLRLLNKGNSTQTLKGKQYVNKSRMYYHWRIGSFCFSALNGTPRQVLLVILGDSETTGKIPKCAKGLSKIITYARKVDSRMDYIRLFHEVVFSSRGEDVFECASSFEDVLTFVLICMSRIFPDIVFGSAANKKHLVAAIRLFLRLERKESYDVGNFVRLLEISSVSWLGKSKLISSTHDLSLRQKLLLSFIKWLFGDFIVHLIRKFWYVTESHSMTKADTGSIYFPHMTWKALTDNWIYSYVDKYLREAWITRSEVASYFNHGCLRILPKNKDFRPLCIPCKHLFSNELNASWNEAFRIHDWNVIRPLREILRLQQAKVDGGECPRIYSTRGISMHLKYYKDSVFENEQSKPTIYGLKFDMKHCYDNLNQSKIIEIIVDLFAGDSEDEEYFVRRIFKSKSLEGLHSKLALVITKRLRISELDVIRFPDFIGDASPIVCDDSKVWKFSKGMILDIVKHQVVNSSIELPMLPQRTFKRKRGIFQGTALLATFCDIVYNRLADELFAQINNRNESVLLRLADDFLFLSTREENCKKMFDMATSSLANDYGAYINIDKCSWINGIQGGTFNFVGLDIDIKTLNVRSSNLQTYRVPRNSQSSFAKVLQYLRWNCGVRLSSCQLDLKLLNETGIVDNIKDVLEPTFDSVSKLLPHDATEYELDTLMIFCGDTLSFLITRILDINGYGFTFDNLYRSFARIMTTKLQSRIPGIQNLIRLLLTNI